MSRPVGFLAGQVALGAERGEDSARGESPGKARNNSPLEESPGTHVGRYKLREKLGEGAGVWCTLRSGRTRPPARGAESDQTGNGHPASHRVFRRFTRNCTGAPDSNFSRHGPARAPRSGCLSIQLSGTPFPNGLGVRAGLERILPFTSSRTPIGASTSATWSFSMRAVVRATRARQPEETVQ